ncbi:MAG TPA: MBL fold metallo-hydrolase [Acidimicrobiia bacterium]|nr:MBL fold metallo-hydrolase [Acidimicrobiia bacterium]
MTARVTVLVEGYATAEGVASTIGLIEDGDRVIVVDPGMVPRRDLIRERLWEAGSAPELVTDIVISHHHPDHTINIAVFPEVPVHDHWAIYQGDRWTDRPAEGAQLSSHVRLTETPGHSPQDITTLVDTPDGVVAFTHLWWFEGIEGDRRATDLESLFAHRERIIGIADLIVPGHGPAFEVRR